MFTFIPKNACTSWRTNLAYANGCIADVTDWAWVHNNNATFSASIADLACAPATVVILRCPFRRLASTFTDKIVSHERELWTLRRLTRDAFDPNRQIFRDVVHWIGQKGCCGRISTGARRPNSLCTNGMMSPSRWSGWARSLKSSSRTQAAPFWIPGPFSGRVTASTAPLEGQGHADTPPAELTLQKSQGYLLRPADLFDAVLIANIRRLYDEDFRLYLALAGAEGLMFTTTGAGSKA